MSLTSSDNSRFFGMDLSQWPRQWQAAGALLLGLPGLSWLTPAVRVRLRHADGRRSVWDVTHGVAMPARDSDARAQAVELPADSVLERRLMLPPLAPADLAQAVRLEVTSASPFGAGQTVFGYAAAPARDGVCRVDVAITSRQQAEQALRAASDLAAGIAPELWVLPVGPAGHLETPLRPVVLQGFGEGVRQRAGRRALALRVGLLALALALLGGLVVTPTALLRQRAMQSERSFAALQTQAAPQIAQREALMQRVERLQTVGHVMENQLAFAPVLDMLTRTVPDGAWIIQLRAEGNKLVLNGNADDAAALVQLLAAQPGTRDVRLASPAIRSAGAAKETFTIEMYLDPARYGLTRGGAAGAAS